MPSRRSCWLGALAGLVAVRPDRAIAADPPKPRPDLADIAAGIYDGDVISDARGSSRSGVRLTVVKTGPNTVQVTSSYRRLPPFSTRLTRAMDTIQQVGSQSVFLLDLSKRPFGLDVTIDDASWSGARSA